MYIYCLPYTRFSIPYRTPLKKYIPLEGVVEKVPNYAYQLYFANPESTEEIEANVRDVFGVPLNCVNRNRSSNDSCGCYMESRCIRKISRSTEICERPS